MADDSLIVACPKCAKKYRVNAPQVGKKVRCKQCQTVFYVGASPTEQTAPVAAPPVRKPPLARPAPPRRTTAPAQAAVEINLEGEWEVLSGEFEGLPCIVRVNQALEPIAGRGYHCEDVTIFIYFDSPGDNGMPTDQADLARVDRTEDLITEALQTAGESLLAIAITTGGRRQLTFYSRDSQSAVSRFQQLAPQLPSRNMELTVEDDPQWAFYHRFVG